MFWGYWSWIAQSEKKYCRVSQVMFRLLRFRAGTSLTVLESSTIATCSALWKTTTTRATSAVNTNHWVSPNFIYSGAKWEKYTHMLIMTPFCISLHRRGSDLDQRLLDPQQVMSTGSPAQSCPPVSSMAY